jgi:hypothetical protein
MPGLLINVRRIELAVIDPWQIIVEDVGQHYSDTCSAFAHSASKLPMLDARVMVSKAGDGRERVLEGSAGAVSDLENGNFQVRVRGRIGERGEEGDVEAPGGGEASSDWELLLSDEEEDAGA